jgi:RimJ/RimL family protein N-acetyltransferase
MIAQQTPSRAALPAGALPVPTMIPTRQPRRPGAGTHVLVRPLQLRDAESLWCAVTTEAVTRFIPAPPGTADGFRQFATWTEGQQRAGRQWCFAIVPHACGNAAGLIQVRRCDRDAGTVEWGFVLAQRFWGTGVFAESAAMVLDTLFGALGVQRVEALTAPLNGRGSGALRKLGFSPERDRANVIVNKHGQFDQTLWAITPDQWKKARQRVLGRASSTGRRSGAGMSCAA